MVVLPPPQLLQSTFFKRLQVQAGDSSAQAAEDGTKGRDSSYDILGRNAQ
jgi:hypothetical protein